MRLPRALGLGGLIQALPASALLDVGAVDASPRERLDHREHRAIAQIAVVGDGEYAPAGLLFVGGHPLPKIARIVAAERLHRGVGLYLTGPVAAVAVDHVAVQVVAARIRGPLVADEGCEPAGLVVRLRRRD